MVSGLQVQDMGSGLRVYGIFGLNQKMAEDV